MCEKISKLDPIIQNQASIDRTKHHFVEDRQQNLMWW